VEVVWAKARDEHSSKSSDMTSDCFVLVILFSPSSVGSKRDWRLPGKKAYASLLCPKLTVELPSTGGESSPNLAKYLSAQGVTQLLFQPWIITNLRYFGGFSDEKPSGSSDSRMQDSIL
jgi:hypothetical protein